MDYDIKRNSLDNYISETKTINQYKTFQERPMKKYKNKSLPMNDDFKYVRNNKLKKNLNSFDNQAAAGNEMLRGLRPDNNVESFSYKSFNGDNKSSKYISHNCDRKNSSNRATNDYTRNISYETKTNYPKPKDKFDSYRQTEVKPTATDTNAWKGSKKSIATTTSNKVAGKVKWTFLQESQLVTDKYEASSEASVVTDHSSTSQRKAGLNPAAVEFTPNSTTTLDLDSRLVQRVTDGLKSMSLDSQLKEDPTTSMVQVVMMGDSSEYTGGGKVATFDSTPLNNHLYPQCRPISRFAAFNQNLVPQFQLMYGANPTLFRYGPTQNLSTVHLQGNYFLYNPAAMMCNMGGGMYTSPTPLLTTGHLAHSFQTAPGPHWFPTEHHSSSSTINGGVPHIR